MVPRRTVSARAMGPLFLLMQRHGVELGPLLVGRDIDPRWLQDPDCRVPSQRIDGLWEDCARVSGLPDMGLMAAELARIETFGIFSYMCVTSPTIGDGIRRAVRYFAVLAQGVDYVLEEGAERFRLHLRDRSGGFASTRHDVECSLALPFLYMRRYAATPWTPTQVRFRHPEPASTEAHVALFGVCPEFATSDVFFEGDAAVLSLPSTRSDHALSTLLEEVSRHQLAQLRPWGEAREEVFHWVQQALDAGRRPTVAEAARALGTSTRALQRTLREAGQSFRGVVDDVRRARTEALLRRPELTITDVAFLVGYADQSSFQRAFRRWFGTTPRAFRAALPPPRR